MSVENVTVETETRQLPREYGIVTYRFTWTGFATVSGDRIEAGDAIAGLFLDRGTTLLIAWPETHRVDTIDRPRTSRERRRRRGTVHGSSGATAPWSD